MEKTIYSRIKTKEDIRRTISLLEKRISSAEEKIEHIQNKCDHSNYIAKPGADTGNWCKDDDRYWVDVMCPDCGKTMRFYSNKEKELYYKYLRK